MSQLEKVGKYKGRGAHGKPTDFEIVEEPAPALCRENAPDLYADCVTLEYTSTAVTHDGVRTVNKFRVTMPRFLAEYDIKTGHGREVKA